MKDKGLPALHFVKMHGAGNDYIFFDCFTQTVENPEELSIAISHRHFGVGGDGIVLIMMSEVADCRMRMFNADGSEGKMCGNAIRCVGKYFYENISQAKTTITVETLSGIKELKLSAEGGKVASVSVDMGRADFKAKSIPILTDKEEFVAEELQFLDRTFIATAVSVGNPHCVIEVDNVEHFEVEKYGKVVEMSELFPERVNTEFIRITGEREMELRVWERGSGETMACGTGASASVSAMARLGKLPFSEEIRVKLLGGELFIRVNPDFRVSMRGEAVEVFRGEWIS